jgi:RND family efflux transporter MFP subunit
MQLSKPSRRIAATFNILAISVLFLCNCSKKPVAAESDETSGDSAALVAEVTLTKVVRMDIHSSLSVTGTISAPPNQDVRVSSMVAGRIARLMAAEGDLVRSGQVLAKIEDRPFRDQIQQAEAAVEQARANLENARLNRERNENLFQRGIAARKEVEDARTQVSVTEASLRQAEAALALARLQLSRTEVRSPLDGTVVKRLVSAGEQVDGTAAQPIYEVANLTEVELYGNVPAVYLGRIRVGQALRISTEAFATREFLGRVVAISPAVDPATNVGLVRIRIANRGGLLRLGMFLTAQVPLETHPHALVVPPQAIYRDPNGNPRVYRVQGDRADAVEVTTGIESRDWIELLSGAQEGETVILAGGYGLANHANIKVRQ